MNHVPEVSGCVYDHGDWHVAHPEMIDFTGSLLSLMYLQQTTQSSLSVLSLNYLSSVRDKKEKLL